MAGIGEAATIAGLLSLAGQAVQAATVLYTYLKAYKDIHPRISDAAQELEHLHLCLSEIWKAASLAATGASASPSSLELIFTSLDKCYECMRQVEVDLDSVKGKARKGLIKKLKIAAEKDYFLNITVQLSVRRQELLLLLSTSSWYVFRNTRIRVSDADFFPGLQSCIFRMESIG
jgi:hypothetical protein